MKDFFAEEIEGKTATLALPEKPPKKDFYSEEVENDFYSREVKPSISKISQTKPKSKNILLETLKLTGKDILSSFKDVPAQVQDISSIPSRLAGFKTIPLQSKLATEAIPKTMESLLTPSIPIPDFSLQTARNLVKGKLSNIHSELFSPVDLTLMFGIPAVGAGRNIVAKMQWNKYLDYKSTILKNLDGFETAIAKHGKSFPSGMSPDSKVNIILAAAEKDPKLGSIIVGLEKGKIAPIKGRVDVTSTAKVSPTVKTPVAPVVSPSITPKPAAIMPTPPITPVVPPSVAVQPLSPTGQKLVAVQPSIAPKIEPQVPTVQPEIRPLSPASREEAQQQIKTLQKQFNQALDKEDIQKASDIRQQIKQTQEVIKMKFPAKRQPKTLIGYVISQGGLDPQKLAKDYNVKLDFQEAGLLSVLRKGGRTLDDFYDELVEQNLIPPAPENINPMDWVKQQITESKGKYLEGTKAFEKQLEKEYNNFVESEKVEGVTDEDVRAEQEAITQDIEKEITAKSDEAIIGEANWRLENYDEFAKRIDTVTTPEELKDILTELTQEASPANKDAINELTDKVDERYLEITKIPTETIPGIGEQLLIKGTKQRVMPPTLLTPKKPQKEIQLTGLKYGLSPEKQGELFKQSIQQAPTVNIGEPPTETGITSEAGQAVIPEVNIPSSSIVKQSGNLVKYFLGTKEERWKVILGEEKGRKVFETLRYFDRAVNLASALTEARNKALFRGIGIKTRGFIFDVLKGIKRIDGNGVIEFGALQPSGIIQGEFAPGQLLPDGRIVGEAMDEAGSQFMTYRKYNTEKAYYKLIAKYPKAKAVIDQYLANEEVLKKTILGTDIPAFSRNILKRQFNIKTNQPEDFSYVPSMLKEQRILGKIKNIFKSYTAGGRKKKTGALAEAGLEEKDILKALTVRQQELIYEDLSNNAAGDILAMVLEPIEGRRLKPGYIQVNINSPRIQKITQLKKEALQANGIDPDKLSLFQYPAAVDKEFNLSETTRFANPELQQVYNNAKKISDTFISGVTTNYLIRPSTTNRNFISGLIQYNLRTLTHIFEGNLPAAMEDIKALGFALKPSVRRAIPSEVLGGTFVSDIAGKKSVFSPLLAPFRAIEYYFKRASFEADLNTIARKMLWIGIKSGKVKASQGKEFIEDFKKNYFIDLFQMMSDNANSVTYDYWDKPYILEKLNKGLVPFPNYIYHKTRAYLEYSPVGLAGINKTNARNKIGKALAGIATWLAVWAIADRAVKEREKQMEELAFKRIDVAFDTTGRIKFYADDEVERWLRVYDIPFLGDMMYWREISQGRADFGDWASDALSLGPLMKVPLILMGLKNKYEQGKTTPSLVGEQMAGWIPFSSYLRYARVLQDPVMRKTYSNDYSAFENFVNPFKDVIPEASKTIPERVAKTGIDKGKIKTYDIPTETMKLLFLNVKSIDKQEYMQYVNDQIYSGKVQKRIEKQARDK